MRPRGAPAVLRGGSMRHITCSLILTPRWKVACEALGRRCITSVRCATVSPPGVEKCKALLSGGLLALRQATYRTLVAHEGSPNQEKQDTGQTRGRDVMHRQPKESEMIEAERSDHLAGDDQRDHGRRTQLRKQKNRNRYVDRSEESPCPRNYRRSRCHSNARYGLVQRKCHNEHHDGAAEIAYKPSPPGRSDLKPQVRVHSLLKDKAYARGECKQIPHGKHAHLILLL